MKQHTMFRRLFALVIALCFMLPLEAQAVSSEYDDGGSPYYIGTSTISASIGPYTSDTVECWGHVDCYRGYTADAVMRLQWLDVDGVWMDYKNWYDDGNAVTFYGTQTVPHGRRYRVKVVADIFKDSTGEKVEVVGATSGSMEY